LAYCSLTKCNFLQIDFWTQHLSGLPSKIFSTTEQQPITNLTLRRCLVI
jgi:hypothetical protein